MAATRIRCIRIDGDIVFHKFGTLLRGGDKNRGWMAELNRYVQALCL